MLPLVDPSFPLLDFAETEFLPLTRPTISEEAIAEVVDTLRSGWLTTGPKVQQFEHDLRQYLDSPYALSIASATAGLFIVLMALDFAPGDEVITTPMTFAGTLNVIELCGLKPVLVDIDPQTYNMDVSLIEQAITSRTRAIMPVHFAGLSVDMDPILALAEKYQLRVIEDAAHAIGTQYKERKIGSFGDIQVFSFHPNKNMTTGEGGVITLRDEALKNKIAVLKFHGMDRDAWNRFGKSGSPHYEIITPGHKFNMTDIQAAIGLHQLPMIDAYNARRQVLASRYYVGLRDCPGLILPGVDPATTPGHAWHLFAPIIAEGHRAYDRDSLIGALKQHNIGTGVHYRAVHLYPYYREKYGYQPGSFPHAERVGNNVFSLPFFPQLSEANQDRVITTLKSLLAGASS